MASHICIYFLKEMYKLLSDDASSSRQTAEMSCRRPFQLKFEGRQKGLSIEDILNAALHAAIRLPKINGFKAYILMRSPQECSRRSSGVF
jgi:hypothetical protein